ncbi:mitochondrial coenzyme A diphosphatase NUDT8 [Neodiprion virginianus]|uniref:mitochondrial coenzyme A diphosphatase NUDT8 n=1 Tax=Neodiprion virginianus TaxID=2961670 RepID=UPI001EE72E23|nr:mitochondrial coenzyme A diphosphatase NUDT8 [Neodiprion virginianus]
MNIVKESFVCRSASRRLFLRSTPVEPQRRLSGINGNDLKADIILNANNRKVCVKNLKLYRPASRSSNREEVSKAAVLVPLCMHKGELGLLYTLRSTKLNTNRGQVSFPGGMHDKDDKTLEETAIRETWEELRIPREKIDVWGSGNPMGRQHVSVLPVLAYIGDIEPNELQLNTDEVEEAFVLSLNNLCDPTKSRFTQFRDSFTLPTYLAGKHRVWGLTAAITHVIMKALVPNVYKHKLAYAQPVHETNSASNITNLSVP